MNITRMVAVDDEQRLVTQSRHGEPGAFEQLIREHQRMVHSLCHRMTGSMDDADDLAQETFIQAHQHLASFRSESRFSSWLYRIAMNQCLNWQKSRARQDRLQKEWAAEERAESRHEDPRAELVQTALMKLDPKQRAAVILTTYDGLSHAEVAKAMRCSETTVSWRLFAARAKLKRLLKNLSKQENER